MPIDKGSSRQRRGASRALASLVGPLTRAAFAERGFHHAAILTEWRAIVGDRLADRCAALSSLATRISGTTGKVERN